jgi:hypothetical protein
LLGGDMNPEYPSTEEERIQIWPGTSEEDSNSLLDDIIPQSVRDQRDKENDGRCPTSCHVYWGLDK